MLSVKMLGLGYYLPKTLVTSEDLDKRLHLALGSVEKKSGLKQRHFVNKDETTSFMGAEAAKRAIADAQITLDEVDAIIGACGVGEQAIPCNAALIQRQLGLENSGIPCFDINSTCISFLTAVDTASYLITGKKYRNVLIVSSEIPSSGLNWQDMETCTIFGDGAAACVLGQSDGDSKIIHSHFETHSSGADFCKVESCGTRILPSMHQDFPESAYFQMDGKKVFKLACKLIKHTHQVLLNETNMTISDIDWVIPHQASKLGIHHVRKLLGISPDKYADMFDRIGNQMAASIPTVMCLLKEQKKLKRGQTLYLLGSGAGLAINGMIMVY